MSKAIWKFTKREIVRIIKAALAAGILAPRLEFRPDGTIVLLTGSSGQPQSERNESVLDQWMARHAREA